MIRLFFRDLRAGLRRRWLLALLGLFLTLGAGAAVARMIPPTYQAAASVILVPPSGAMPVGSNPFLYMGGLATTVDVLSRSLSDEQTRQSILGTDTALDYTATPDPTSAGPILQVTASGPTPEAAMATLATVVAKVPSSLAQVQSTLGIDSKTAITSMTLTHDDKAKAVQKTRIRATLAVTAVFAGLTLLLIGLIDGLLLRRAARKTADASDAEDDADAVDAVVPEFHERLPMPGAHPGLGARRLPRCVPVLLRVRRAATS
jgi:hypothetical protein